VRLGQPGQLLVTEAPAYKIRSINLSTGIINTYAGSGSSAYGGDGLSATAAGFVGPQDFVNDGAGKTYIADNIYSTYPAFVSCGFFCFYIVWVTTGESRIRVVDSFGNITTVAGGPQLNNTGDGGQGNLARLGSIQGLALKGTTLYMADAYFDVIRTFNTGTGIVSFLGGVSGTAGYAGDGFVVSGSTLFNAPKGMAADASGNLYIADSGNNAIRRIDAASLSITTVCGLGPSFAGYSGDSGPASQAALFNPSGLYIDAGGNIFIADTGNDRIRRIDAMTKVINTVAGDGFRGFEGDGGPALQARLHGPEGVFSDAAGTLYISDTQNNRLRKVDYVQSPTPTPAASGPGKSVAYPSPASDRICFAYTAQQSGHVVVEIYNSALQLAAKVEDDIALGNVNTCGSISGLAVGAYLYRITAPGTPALTGKFKVIH
jgi:sugar lactone lactonase YvrE